MKTAKEANTAASFAMVADRCYSETTSIGSHILFSYTN